MLASRDLSLGSLLDRLAVVHGERRLFSDENRTRTYQEAAEDVAAMSSAVARATGPGDRVVVATANGYDQLLCCLAVARAGAVAVPVNPAMSETEVDGVIADAGAALVVRDAAELRGTSGLKPAALPVAANAGDLAAIFYTSGTTGRPKGARLSNRALLGPFGRAALWPAALHRDEAVVALPAAHIMGFITLLGFAAAGIPVHVLERFRADAVLDAIEQRRATMFVGVPSMYRMLEEAGADDRDLRSVRVWMSGADVMPADLARRFQRRGGSLTLPFLGFTLGEALFVEGYGMVESGGGVAFRVSPPLASRLPLPFGDALGIPLPGWQVKVVREDGSEAGWREVGELWVRGPGVLEGYHGDDEATTAVLTEDGWLRTGDLAQRGPLGLVRFVGRAKDVIKSGGYSVYAVEVESMLEEHPAVAEAAVAGVADERLGEIPVAAVRLDPSTGAQPSAEDLIAWASGRVAAYKVPRRLRIVSELPRTGTEKVQRAKVRELFDYRNTNPG